MPRPPATERANVAAGAASDASRPVLSLRTGTPSPASVASNRRLVRLPSDPYQETLLIHEIPLTVSSSGVRGCSVEIKRLEPQCDYKFRVIAENKHGTSQPSPYVIAHR